MRENTYNGQTRERAGGRQCGHDHSSDKKREREMRNEREMAVHRDIET